MPKVCHGWIEILDEAGWWHSTVRINALVPQAPEVTSALFGVDDHRVRRPSKPIASVRGLPDDMSETVRHEFDEEGQWAHFATWIMPNEIAKVFKVQKLEKGWSLVFSFMGALADLYGEKNVRLIVWFI